MSGKTRRTSAWGMTWGRALSNAAAGAIFGVFAALGYIITSLLVLVNFSELLFKLSN